MEADYCTACGKPALFPGHQAGASLKLLLAI